VLGLAFAFTRQFRAKVLMKNILVSTRNDSLAHKQNRKFFSATQTLPLCRFSGF
jgi:hypothetical protein